MFHPYSAYEVASSRYKGMRRESEEEMKLRQLMAQVESPWRKSRTRLLRLLSIIF